MKKIILLLSATVFLISCNKNKYVISGTIKGIENGRTVIMETQDPMGQSLMPVDTVKIENGKFKIEGKASEPVIQFLQFEGVSGKVPFILENGDITIEINKDSLDKAKISGTYNNDEFYSFNKEIFKIQKSLIDFQTKNTPLMTTAQKSKDTVTINKLLEQYGDIQKNVGELTRKKYVSYAESHPKSFISALIIDGMSNDPSVDLKKLEKLYADLDASLKTTKPGKSISSRINQIKAGPGVAPVAPTEPVQSAK